MIVFIAVCYLMACVLGTVLLLGSGKGTGALTLGQFSFLFFVAGPACFIAYLMVQAGAEAISLRGAVFAALIAVALGIGWALLW